MSSAQGSGVFKRMQPVPPLASFLDIVLSKTQRKTPTVVHKGYPLPRIRAFYMRKVKFARDAFVEKLSSILSDFPRLEDVHPFYGDLANVLYDRDHYKLALGQLHTARTLITKVAADYVKLLKYGDSLYRCKSLKRAALGRMATVLRRQRDALAYLEQVRQHMSRLPAIDPQTRTLLLCGYPNVGKSSFMNCVTKAHVDVQSYAFTTKSLYVGHFDYRLLRWQVIDTPGVLDHPLDERNTIEMQAITALAHVRACVLYFVDVSETCGYSIAQQIALFASLRPLFAGKPVMVVLNKIDLTRPADICSEDRELLQTAILDAGVPIASASCASLEGVYDVRNGACDMLLEHRVGQKINAGGHKIGDILNRLHLAVPKPRDSGVAREPFIPEAVRAQRELKVRGEQLGLPPRLLSRDVELQSGGAGVYSVDLRASYRLADPTWTHDVIPEIVDGHNVADFVDADVTGKLARLQAEDELYDYDERFLQLDAADRDVLEQYDELEGERKFRAKQSSQKSRHARRPLLAERIERKQGRLRRTKSDDAGDSEERRARAQRKLARRLPRTDKSRLGMRDEQALEQSGRLKRLAQRTLNLHARRGEADRHIQAKKPKWLFSGKRTLGSANHR